MENTGQALKDTSLHFLTAYAEHLWHAGVFLVGQVHYRHCHAARSGGSLQEGLRDDVLPIDLRATAL